MQFLFVLGESESESWSMSLERDVIDKIDGARFEVFSSVPEAIEYLETNSGLVDHVISGTLDNDWLTLQTRVSEEPQIVMSLITGGIDKGTKVMAEQLGVNFIQKMHYSDMTDTLYEKFLPKGPGIGERGNS